VNQIYLEVKRSSPVFGCRFQMNQESSEVRWLSNSTSNFSASSRITSRLNHLTTLLQLQFSTLEPTKRSTFFTTSKHSVLARVNKWWKNPRTFMKNGAKERMRLQSCGKKSLTLIARRMLLRCVLSQNWKRSGRSICQPIVQKIRFRSNFRWFPARSITAMTGLASWITAR
jgi:hypothetical protein